MRKPNYNQGTYLIHNGQEIHNEKQQVNIFAPTWANIIY